MSSAHTYRICFCGISIRFVFPGPVELPASMLSFLCEEDGPADFQFRIELLTQPLPLPDAPLHTYRDTEIYRTDKGWLRVCTPLITEDGLQVACLLCPDGNNLLYYPASMWDFYASPIRCLHLIGIETLLLSRDAMLLHSSVVLHEGKAVLFSGPAGAGKSTQADLWQKHLGAQVLNGDRCVIRRYPDGFLGGGSPWAGTSGIYRREQAPIAAIFLVCQAPENAVQPLGAAAFGPLLSQTVVNSWDRPFMEQITGLLGDLLCQVPIYLLRCRPDPEAVFTALDAIS